MEEATVERPQWLLDLENRKRKPRLAHEAGAGAPCSICNSSCPGLDLHFWRKICKICKCSRDDHQVDDDDFPQFDLLFGSSAKLKKKSTLLRITGKKQCEGESIFEWVPPDTSKELATDYMKALPVEKLPITGSSGALLRKQLLQKQLPLHDFDHEACSSLSEEEKQEFEKYLENLKKYVGQGKVTKMLAARPFDKSLMTPANATDVQRFSPQRKPQVPSVSAVPALRTPSSFVKALPYTKKTPSSENRQEFPNGLKSVSGSDCSKTMGKPHKLIQSSSVSVCNTVTSEVLQCQPGIYETCKWKEKLSCKQSNDHTIPCCNSAMCRSVPYAAQLASYEVVEEATKMHSSPFTHTEKLTMEDAENMLADALLPPSAIRSQDIIGSTLDEQGLMYIRDKLNSKYSIQEAPQEVHANTASIIELNSRSRDRPTNAALNVISSVKHKSTSGDSRENSQETKSKLSTVANVPINVIHSESSQKQVFPYEAIGEGQSDDEKGVNPSEIHRMNDAMKGLTVESSKTQNCDKCRGEIHVGDVVVNVEKAKNAVWHPGCFVCSMCEELLVDLVYFYYKNKLYCARDLATLLGIPRCFACDELIFVREYTVAEGHNYHVKHFCCWDCDVPLAGQRYISENDRPLCLPCYQKTYAQTCNTCNSVIAADQQGVAIKNLNFHANEQCFCCYTCKKNLLNNKFAIKEEKLFCSKECISKYFNKNSLA